MVHCSQYQSGFAKKASFDPKTDISAMILKLRVPASRSLF